MLGRGLLLKGDDGALEARDKGQDLGNRRLRGYEETIEEANDLVANDVVDRSLVG